MISELAKKKSSELQNYGFYPGSLWKHYKGQIYQIAMLCLSEESLDAQVVYHDFPKREAVFVRPMSQFLDYAKENTRRFQNCDIPSGYYMTQKIQFILEGMEGTPISMKDLQGLLTYNGKKPYTFEVRDAAWDLVMRGTAIWTSNRDIRLNPKLSGTDTSPESASK